MHQLTVSFTHHSRTVGPRYGNRLFSENLWIPSARCIESHPFIPLLGDICDVSHTMYGCYYPRNERRMFL